MERKIIKEGKWTNYMDVSGWEYITRKDDAKVVSVITKTKHNTLILIKQFRLPMGKFVIEFPAGLIDAGEHPSDAAVRELKEETGIKGTIEHILGPCSKSAGITDEQIYIVYMTEQSRGEQELEEDEDIEVLEVLLEPRAIKAFIQKITRSQDTNIDSNVRIYLQEKQGD